MWIRTFRTRAAPVVCVNWVFGMVGSRAGRPAILIHTKALGHYVRVPVLKYLRLCAARKIPVIFGVWIET